MNIRTIFGNFIRYGFWGSAADDTSGVQNREPTSRLVPGSHPELPDAGMQLSAVWACVMLLSETIASIPIAVYRVDDRGNKNEARDTNLWHVLRNPNAIMTAHDFWLAMGLNRFLRGNAFALISRSGTGDLVSLVPLAADQMQVATADGKIVYEYYKDGNITVYSADKILHWKGLGNGIIGMSTLDYMQGTTMEMSRAQSDAARMFGNGRQLTGVLMVDQDLSAKQIAALQARYSNLPPVVGGANDFLHVLPGDMKFQQIAMSAEDAQLLQTRKFGIDEIGRWFGVPSALINATDGSSASAIEPIVESFYRSTIHPLCVAIEQAIRQRVMTQDEQMELACEFKLNALQRANISSRYESYSKALQNGFMTRNEVRKLENLEPLDGADELTAQSNLWPVSMLGQQNASQSQTPVGAPIKQ